ncbi:MAG: M48 family metallopeptidase [Proteobacteria bacterium]|nr:M48 family metallopeptidase [Pseudomonadota bacterium]
MRNLPRFVFILLLVLILAACTQVPVTGRSQLNFIPNSQIMSMSSQQYQEFLQENKVVKGTAEARMVQSVGARVAGAVEAYFRQEALSDRISDYKWEFNLVADDQINAFAMPGGKVVVYEGLLPVSKTEAGLAAVIGHEVAHAVAEHGSERMSQLLLTQLGGMALSVALSDKPQETQALYMTAFGLGTTVGLVLPFSRLQEKEADHLGLIFMAMAGYDPHEAVTLWERMAAQKDGAGVPEFLSTHPADQTRISLLKDYLPEAMRYYHPQ